MRYDYLIVGAGLFGGVFARRMAEGGRTSLVVDRRGHLGGNCYTEAERGVQVHRYGPHVFHTASDRVWGFVNRFACFNDYRLRVRSRAAGQEYSFPINLRTLRQLWGVSTPEEAADRIARERRPIADPQNARDWILSQVGPQLYETFFHGYTRKQWGRDPAELPASIARRIPIRLTDDERYFQDHTRHEGVPHGGYTALFENLLDDPKIRVELGVDFLGDRERLQGVARRVVYSGKIDQYFKEVYGPLEYRSLRFESELCDGLQQSVALVNHPDLDVPYTRSTEHVHFERRPAVKSVLTREYPQPHTPDNEPFYPVRDAENLARLARYENAARSSKTLFGGRLGTYRYYDMDQVIAAALARADAELHLQPAEN